MSDRAFFGIFFIFLLLFGWKHNYLPTVILLLFGSKDTVPQNNIIHEDPELPSNFYSGIINDDVDGKDNAFACGGSCFQGQSKGGAGLSDRLGPDFTKGPKFSIDRSDDWKLFADTDLGANKDLGEQDSRIPGLQDVFKVVVMVLALAAFVFMVLFDKRKMHGKYDKEGKSIGKLVVSTKEIAKGSNGTVVFEGMYEGRKVAVKRVVRAHHDVARKEIENLIDSDQHPNIIRWYGVEYDPDFVYLALERCDCTLYDLIQNNSTLWRPNDYPSHILLNLMRDIVVGLVHLHELGIIHRDLKPHNVLIIKRKGLCAKISDMGISRRLVRDMSSLEPNATCSGSSGWQAPEQLRFGRQTRAMDLFSLGCVIFFCVTRGKHPFGDHLERDINVTKNKVNLLLVEHIPEAVSLVSRLLNPNPELRPKASEVLHQPLFWNSETRLSFLKDTSDRLESEQWKASIVLKVLERKGRVAFNKKWDDKMGHTFISYMEKHRLYKYNSVRCLLRFIRNNLNHHRQLPKEIQELLGSVPEGFDDYFRSRFPKLLMKVYSVMYLYCKQEEWFRNYLKS